MDDVRLVTHPQAASNWYITLADIILLLMTFFVMLLSLSTISDVRTRAVIDSVSASFSLGGNGPRGRADPYVASDGDILGAQDFQKRVGQVIQATIPAAKVTIVRPGMLMEMEADAESLFLPDKAELRPAQREFLDQLVAAVAVPPPGRRLEVEFTARLQPGADGLMPTGESLPVARAGGFAREITGRGLAAQVLTVGVERGAPGKVRLLFRLVHAETGAAQD